MTTLFRCPECKAMHAEPRSAEHELNVRCTDCELELELVDWRRLGTLLPEAA